MRADKRSGELVVGAALAVALLLGGCGHSSVSTFSPVQAGKTGTFYSDYNYLLIGDDNLVPVGRGFITLENGVPTALGIEVSAQAVREFNKMALQREPDPEFDVPTIYGINLPPEVVYTPFTYVAVSYWSAHSPVGIGDVPHWHPLFGIGPPQLPDPDEFFIEKVPAYPEEVPQDYLNGDGFEDAGITTAPGIGLAYEDPAQPQLHPGWDSTGQNYFFYQGHMNGIGLGATDAFLLRQQQGRETAVTDVIKQPQVYPKPGYYPHRYRVSYDPKTRTHTFVLEDWRKARDARPRVFFGRTGRLGKGSVRGFVRLKDDGVTPEAVGWELSPEVLQGLPPAPLDATLVYAAPLPPEGRLAALKHVAVVYSAGHLPPEAVEEEEPAHFHAAFLRQSIQQPSPGFAREDVLAAPPEVPEDHIAVVLPSGGHVIVPGIGISYDDPTQPGGLPALSTLGQNYFFYEGHLNGIAIGPTLEELESRQTFSEPIKQPQVYPEPGYYPHRWSVRYDEFRKMHLLTLEDWRLAGATLR